MKEQKRSWDASISCHMLRKREHPGQSRSGQCIFSTFPGKYCTLVMSQQEEAKIFRSTCLVLRIQHSMVAPSLAFFLPSLLSSSLPCPPLSTSLLLARSLALSLALARAPSPSLPLPPHSRAVSSYRRVRGYRSPHTLALPLWLSRASLPLFSSPHPLSTYLSFSSLSLGLFLRIVLWLSMTNHFPQPPPPF